MTYPNAAKGIEKLHIAEILIIIGTFIDDLCVNLVTGNQPVFDVDYLDKIWLIIIMIAIIAGSVLIVIGDILNLIGLRFASKDDKLFKLPLYLSFALIIMQIALRIIFFNGHGEAVDEFLEFAEEIIEFIQMICVIVACRRLARFLNGNNMIKESDRMMKLLIVVTIISVASSVVVFLVSEATPIIILVVETVEIISLVVYLRYVDKAIEFLKEN